MSTTSFSDALCPSVRPNGMNPAAGGACMPSSRVGGASAAGYAERYADNWEEDHDE